ACTSKYATSEVSPSSKPGRSCTPVNTSSPASCAAGCPGLGSCAHWSADSCAGGPSAPTPGGTGGGSCSGGTAPSGRADLGAGRSTGPAPAVTCGTSSAAPARVHGTGCSSVPNNANPQTSTSQRRRAARITARPTTDPPQDQRITTRAQKRFIQI